MFGQARPQFNVGAGGFWPGGTVPNPSTFNAAVTMKETLTINKTAESSAGEVIATLKVSDNATGLFSFENGSATDSIFIPRLRGVNSSTQQALLFTAQGTTDTGSTGLLYFSSRIGASTLVTTRPIFTFANHGTSVLDGVPLNSGANLALSWGTQTGAVPSLTNRSVGTRLIIKSAVDASNADYAIGTNGTSVQWYSVPQATSAFAHNFYGATTNVFQIRGDGRLLATGGQVNKARVATTTPVTVADGTDHVVGIRLAAPGAVAVSLPGGVASGTVFEVQDYTGDAGANNITVTPTSGTINGAATDVINSNYGARRYRSDGTNYFKM